MRLSLPRKRTILAWHRWMGMGAAFFLLVVALTGLALNHSERLGLNEKRLQWSWILRHYGMPVAADIRAYDLPGSDVLSFVDGELYLGIKPLATADQPLGFFMADGLVVIVARDAVVTVTDEGELVDRISFRQLPTGRLESLGRDPEGAPVVQGENGVFQPDSEWFTFSPFSGTFSPVTLTEVPSDASRAEAILRYHRGQGVPVDRIILDLHSGRLFGLSGAVISDLIGIAIILLVSSGITGWLRKRRFDTLTR